MTNLHKFTYIYCDLFIIASSLAGMNNNNMADIQTGFLVRLMAMNDYAWYLNM
jgi:hypothetical protein